MRLATGLATISLTLAMPAWSSEFPRVPIFDALVEAGGLWPSEVRLPDNPLVVEPVQGVGDQHNITRVTGHESLVRWSANYPRRDRSPFHADHDQNGIQALLHAKGFRLGPDGKRFWLSVRVNDVDGAQQSPQCA